MKEIFKPVVGYDGLYEISNFGRVKCLEKRFFMPPYMGRGQGIWRNYPEKIMKQRLDRYGYFHVSFSVGGKKKWPLVSRLVGLAFIPNPKNLPQINHIDSDRKNNYVSNLEWVSIKGNCDHKISKNRQTQGENVNTNKLTREEVIQILDLSRSFTQTELARKFSVTQPNIRAILANETWKSLPRVGIKIKFKHYNYGN